MLQAALVSWAVTHAMDALLSICTAIQKLTWEDSMKRVTLVVALAEMLAVYTICSAVIVVGVCLEWLAHVARAAGICPSACITSVHPYEAFAFMASHSASLYGYNNCVYAKIVS